MKVSDNVDLLSNSIKLAPLLAIENKLLGIGFEV
jgi:hypothetical protein